MNGFETMGRWLMMIGLSIVVLGGLAWLLGRLTGWNEFPGTLRINIPGGQCIIPILGSIVVSIVLTVVLNLIIRLLNR